MKVSPAPMNKMEVCEVCGSNNIMYVDDTDIETDDLITLCIDCYKKMFGDPPMSNSMMYT